MPKPNLFGHIRASGQFGPNRAPPTHPPTHPGATHPGATHPPTHPPGRHPPTHPPTRAPPTRGPPTHPPTHPGATNVFGHIPASAQFGPNSRNAKNECFWAHSGFGPNWSEQPECRKRMFLSTFGLQANLVPTGPATHPPTHPPTHPGATYPGATHPPTHPPTHPGATYPGATHPPTHPPIRAPPTRAPPTHPPTHPATHAKRIVLGHVPASPQFGPNSRNAINESFWALSGFGPI